MKIVVTVISSRTLETEPSVALVVEDRAYLFNTPNQLQRTVNECSFKVAKSKQVFFTSLNNHAIGGFYGLFATYYQHFNADVGITGPNGIDDIVGSYIKTFFGLENQISPALQDFEDEYLNVTHIDIGSTFCYSVQLPEVLGKFLPENAIARFIKPGPDFQALRSGTSVVNSKGQIVYPHECCESSSPGERILIVDCRKVDDIDNLNVDLDQYSLIIHFSPEHILFNPKYMQKFPSKQQNLCFINDDIPVFNTACGIYRTRALDPAFHQKNLYSEHRQWVPPVPYTQVSLGCTYKIVPTDKQGFEAEAPSKQQLPKTFRLTFTGTAGNNPTKMRGVSGILLETMYGNIVIDCGEGFVGQITRKYGPLVTKEILQGVRLIWISHHHGDHTYGLHELLESLSSVGNNNVLLSCHEVVLDMINSINIHTDSMSFAYREQIDPIVIEKLTLTSVDVEHVIGSKGCKITADGWSIAYSGDRKAIPGFVEAIESCDVLIHEATYEDDMEEEADKRCHSTTGQAIQTGLDLKAKYIVLTHYSQRYTQTPKYRDDVKNVIAVFDYMSFTYEDMKDLVMLAQ